MNATQAPMLINATGLALVLTTAHALLKWASQKPHATFVELLTSQGAVVGVALALYGGVFLWYLHALRRFELAELFPVYTGLTLVFVACTGVLLFGERLSMMQIGGIGFIAAGVFFLQRAA
ncbi:MAG TPA: SMR family transporter [Casimicrobiaceae bacterium]|jgi:multidrug transporter EmrE-like cation transporter|nr:SMR family transporter [Casimicrobiaceae bacterium]